MDGADIAADIAAGDGAIRYLLKDFIQRVADFLCKISWKHFFKYSETSGTAS